MVMSEIADRLQQQADILFNNIAGWEESVLQRIGARIKKIGGMSLADIKALNNIADVKGDMDEIMRELAKITGTNIQSVQAMYAESLEAQHVANKPMYDYRGKEFVPFAENTRLQAIARAYAKSSGETMLNISKSSVIGFFDPKKGFTGLEKAYKDALDEAVMQVTSGAADFNTAMRDTITKLGGSGVCVNYGSGITRRLDTAVRQSVLWGSKQASNEYNDMIGEELGCDGIEIDWHLFPRPSHEFMQGKQYSTKGKRTIKGTTYEDSDAAGVTGESGALNDYGCLHYATPIICGISVPRYTDKELKELNKKNAQKFKIGEKEVTGYEAKQMMRRLETGIRKEKGEKVTALSSGDTEQVKKNNRRIKAYKAKYNEICDITGLSPETRRMSITATQKSIKYPLQNSGNGGIIKASRNISSRTMANGGRKSPFYTLTDSEIDSLKADINAIGADESVFKFNVGSTTYYDDEYDVIFVKGNVLPDLNSKHPRDLMSSRAVLAHEYYGHRAHRGTKLKPTSWNDEFRASYAAAKNTPNLSDEDRRYLILDALERAKESGISIKYNDYIRRMLNG